MEGRTETLEISAFRARHSAGYYSPEAVNLIARVAVVQRGTRFEPVVDVSEDLRDYRRLSSRRSFAKLAFATEKANQMNEALHKPHTTMGTRYEYTLINAGLIPAQQNN